MTSQEYILYDGVALAKLISEKIVSPKEVLLIAIERAESINPKINAIIHKMYDYADQRSKQVLSSSKLAGIPFLVKDLELAIAGHPMTYGSKCLKDYIPTSNSYIIDKVQDAGMLIMGKTNTSEFGLAPHTEPKLYGPTLNPWNLSHIPGGSSGGSAAAVAAGIVPIASASDGGGSIRMPASCCGLFGLKPSRGRSSLGPYIGSAWNGGVTNLCVSRTVRDTAAYLDIVSGNMPGDPYIIPKPDQSFYDLSILPVKKLKIGWSKQHSFGGQVHPECVKGLEKTITTLLKLGHEVEEIKLPWSAEALTYAFFIMYVSEAAAQVVQASKLVGQKPKKKNFELNTWLLYLLGNELSAKEDALARGEWNLIARTMAQFHEKYDMLLTPTLSQPPLKIGELQNKSYEIPIYDIGSAIGLTKIFKSGFFVDRLARRGFGFMPFTPIQNITGQPSMSVPMYWTDDNLPVGMMFSAKMGEEALLLQLATQLEQETNWIEKLRKLG